MTNNIFLYVIIACFGLAIIVTYTIHDKFLAHAQAVNMTIQQMPLQPMTDPNPPTPGYENLASGEAFFMKDAFQAESKGDIATYNAFINIHNAFVCIHAQVVGDNITMAGCDSQMIQMGLQVHQPNSPYPKWFADRVDEYLKYRRLA